MTWSQRILKYHFNLQPEITLPSGIDWLLPYSEPEVIRCMEQFYNRFYADDRKRRVILGINPGRFGGGATGIPFTDPVRLDMLGIENDFPKKQELSSVFIYDMIEACGGPVKFYNRYYISSLSPLGLVKDGKNYNYYDDADTMRLLTPFIVDHIEKQLEFGVDLDNVFCLGQGKNFKVLQQLNDEHGWWKRVVPLPHPRWIMQYRLRRKEEFIEQYIAYLGEESKTVRQ